MAAEPPLVVPDVLLAVDTSSLKGLLEAILARLRLSEASLSELQNERQLDLPKQGLVARIDKLELEVDALLNDEIPGVDGAGNCPSPRSLRWESCMEDLRQGISRCEARIEETEGCVREMHEATQQNAHDFELLQARLNGLGRSVDMRFAETGGKVDQLSEVVEEHASDIEDLKVKMQEAFNSLQKLDLSNLKEEMDAALRRMERRLFDEMQEDEDGDGGEQDDDDDVDGDGDDDDGDDGCDGDDDDDDDDEKGDEHDDGDYDDENDEDDDEDEDGDEEDDDGDVDEDDDGDEDDDDDDDDDDGSNHGRQDNAGNDEEEELSAELREKQERTRQELDKVVSRFRTQLNDLVESALENMRHSLGQKVLMLDTNDEMVAAGTTKHCISCFKDRSQSPGRGTIGTDGHVYHHAQEAKQGEDAEPQERPTSAKRYGISTAVAAREPSARLGRACQPRPVSSRGRNPERYDVMLENYSRMLARGNDKSIGKLVGILQQCYRVIRRLCAPVEAIDKGSTSLTCAVGIPCSCRSCGCRRALANWRTTSSRRPIAHRELQCKLEKTTCKHLQAGSRRHPQAPLPRLVTSC
ncbi:hypothetical protein AK812_SmicGene33621 [Symbiodinium microadriaticum]|uniref:Replicase polyprotein 1a n=1 Tax=Symbiodinium microadriaticum TaxID=2951 RepID=A0A1Q9CR30_SYMMI|nr:hypothetical protein AK812_SmicGene33621 [Symbiodinium microadriaticum]